MGREILLRRKVYLGFDVRTLGMFPQGTGLVEAKFEPFISRLFLDLVMFWFCSGQPNISCVFHSPVLFLFLSQSIVFKPLRGVESFGGRENVQEHGGRVDNSP